MKVTAGLIIAWLAGFVALGTYVLQISGWFKKIKQLIKKKVAKAVIEEYENNCPAIAQQPVIEQTKKMVAMVLGDRLKWESEKHINRGYCPQEDKEYVLSRYKEYHDAGHNGKVSLKVLNCINLPNEKGGQRSNYTFEDIFKNY
jgi:hypothetical protein